jgi:hypothetical protein
MSGKNYTKPHDENYEDKPEDYLFLVMAFGRALSEMLSDGQGILVDLRGDALKIHPDAKRVVVFNDGDMIRVVNASERTDLKNGDRIMMISKNDIRN